MSQRHRLLLTTTPLLFSLAPVFLMLLHTARPVCPASSDLLVLDNTLLEQPRISCEESRIKMSIRTAQSFAGNVYAKGFFHKDVCRVQGNGSGHVANITIPVNADCGMRRRRSASPHGLSLEIDVILMFHRKFLTKNDRAFHVECQYLEMDQRVGNRLDISALPSTELSQTLTHSQTMPKCHYEVLSGETAHPISFAAIGQPIVHRWSCKDGGSAKETEAAVNLYCLTVHMDDGQGSVQKLLDPRGCPLDKSLFGTVDYKSDLEAVQKGNAFKFADRPTIYFSCQLRLELKSGWKDCKRSADNCGGAEGGGAGHQQVETGAESVTRPSDGPEEGAAGTEGEGGSSSSPDFPTPSSSSFSSPPSSGGFSMSTGTTSGAFPSRPHPSSRPAGEEEVSEEKEEAEETLSKGSKSQQQQKGGKGGGGGGAGKSESQAKQRGKTGPAGVGPAPPEEEGEQEQEGGEGVYVERPTLAIVQKKARRTTRASRSTATTTAAATHSAARRPSSSTTSPQPPKGGVYGGVDAACNPDQFGLNTECAAFDGELPFAPADNDQRFPGRLSLRQRSTTPLEEMERMNNDNNRLNGVRHGPRGEESDHPGPDPRQRQQSSSSSTLDIDVSQAVDVLDVVAPQQSDGAPQELPAGLDQVQQPRRVNRPPTLQSEPAEPFQQLCISRQLLSSALFLALLCVLSSLTLLVCCLLSCQSRLMQRRREQLLPPPIKQQASARLARSRSPRGGASVAVPTAVLDAYARP